jgi:cytochrome c556
LKKYILTLGVSVFAVTVFMIQNGVSGEKQGDVMPAATLPSSLDNYYPPIAPGPIYLASMLDMAAPLSGLTADLIEEDSNNVGSNFESFKERYIKVMKLVPEWESYFPMEPVDKLAAAMKSRDPGLIMPAVDNLGESCNECHYKYMVPTHFKYHWGDFGTLTVIDPVSHTDYPYVAFKHMMETDMNAIGIDMAQGQRENAIERLTGFEQRFEALKETCYGCHDSERSYYVDGKITGMIADLRSKITEEYVDPGEVGEILQGIGEESCLKCHLVHAPAAHAKYQTDR